MNDSVFENTIPPEKQPAPQADRSREKEARRAISRLGLALAAFSLLPQIVATLLFWFVPMVFPAWAESDWFLWAVQVFSMYIVGLCAFFLILGPNPLPPLAREGERFPRKWYVGFFCILMFCAVAGSLISTVLTTAISIFRNAPVEDTTSELISSSPLIYIFLVVVVIGPIVEELVYRYAVMRTLLPYGEKTAVLVSGLIFGLIHGNFFQLFYAVGIGILFSYLYARVGKLRHTIIAHMLFNFFGGFLPVALTQALPLDELLAEAPSFDVILSSLLPLLGLVLYELAYFGLAFAGLIIFSLRCNRARFYPAACPLDGNAQVRVYLANTGMILFGVISLLFLFLSVL